MLQGEAIVVFGGNPRAVVLDFDRVKALILKSDLFDGLRRPVSLDTYSLKIGSRDWGCTDARCASVKPIFDQFFGDRAKIDDDLAGLDLVDLWTDCQEEGNGIQLDTCHLQSLPR